VEQNGRTVRRTSLDVAHVEEFCVWSSPAHWKSGQIVRSARPTVARVPSCKRRTPSGRL